MEMHHLVHRHAAFMAFLLRRRMAMIDLGCQEGPHQGSGYYTASSGVLECWVYGYLARAM